MIMQDDVSNYFRKLYNLLGLFKIYIYMVSCVILMGLDYNNSVYTSYIKEVFISVGFKVSSVTNRGVVNLINISDVIFDYISLKKKNEEMEKELNILQTYYIKTQNIIEENKQLKKLMNLIPDLTPTYKTSKVLGDTYNVFNTTVIINGGKSSSMQNGQVALNELGLVGRIINVYNDVSRLMLLTDINSRVPVITQQSRERAIVKGTGNYKLLKMLYVSEDSNAKIGEPVITSGDGALYPAGVMVGYISDIKNNEYIVTPSVNFSKIDYVMLVERLSMPEL